MNNVAERLAALPAEKRTLLMQRLTQAKRAGASAAIRRQSGAGNSFPLSFAQERMWFNHQWAPDSPLYNEAMVIHLTGRMWVDLLAQALDEFLRRHEILRTVFQQQNGELVQVVTTPQPAQITLVDLCDIAEHQREEAVQQRVTAAAQQPFDLAAWPLYRITLLRVSEEEHVLIFVVHHIIFDGWSAGVLIPELFMLYNNIVHNQPAALPEPPIQYTDYAVWQRAALPEISERQLAYWTAQLAQAPAHLDLPIDRPRPPVRSGHGSSVAFGLPAALTEAIHTLSRQHNVTPFVTLLAAFNVLLYRYTAQTDILIGTPVAGRNRSELEGMVGVFTNTLVLRSRLDGSQTFQALLQHVHQTVMGAFAHQELPFETLVEKLQPARDLSSTPLFQVLFDLQKSPPSPALPAGLTANFAKVHTGTAKFDLSLLMVESEKGLAGEFEYSTDLFDAATIARLIGHFQQLLTSIGDADGTGVQQRIDELPLLTTAEYRQLTVEWNNTEVDYGEVQTIQARFEQQVARTPDAVAVIADFGLPDKQLEIQNSLTYRKLNERANQLAHYLIELGVQPDTLVAVAMDRSLEMVVSLLAILKAGGAYVPIDPTYPSERIAYMLNDSAAPILLTQSHIDLGQEVGGTARQVIAVDQVGEQLNTYPACNPQTQTAPAHLAYVIYTSGSTGQPKGALISHQNVWRLFAATDAWFHFKATDVWTLFHSYAFDFSVWELWGALLYGGRLVVVPYAVSRDPHAFYQLLCDQGVTVLNQTPSAFRQLIPVAVQAQQPNALRYVIFGGEALEFESLRPWFAAQGDAKPQLVNMYGITETTVHVTYQPITLADLDNHQGRSRIGQAIPDLRLYILDPQAKPTPIGVAGELYVGGAGLARGYLNRPELTAERFIHHPQFGRLYKTGDLCRWLADGNIEYIGRTDFQVKIRGFRIELSEIENALLAQDGVDEAVVLAREDQPGDKRLVAYLIGAADSDTLRHQLAQRLPEYMVPAAFVRLAVMPLTANGKLDRRALPAPDYVDTEVVFVAPRNAVEEQLAAIWRDVLGIEQVGVDDNFFALGGHSLLITRVLVQVAELFQVQLSARVFFEAPTVAGLAEALARHEARPGQVAAIAELRKRISAMSAADIQKALQARKVA